MEKKVEKKLRKFIGQVVAANTLKTISVLVSRKKMHPKYKKAYTVSKKYPVHDETGLAKVGDKVSFVECRPMSKTKRFRLMEVLK